ncbi:MAG TPA: hypothetical protein VIN08_13670 [Ohtaekwangia sp.]|uniref:toxin-antitoxin system YwqK family antitoxin n=1 Tax=Ohtaekwangia sp. TaxID=2066019 RepID=UPI002F9266F1
MRIILLALILLTSFNLRAQRIADYINVVGKDSLRLNFKDYGILTGFECATYYRVAKMNPVIFAFNGYSKDYYASGKLAVECSYVNNVLHGFFKSYYENGKTKEQGQVVNGQKKGEWRYWFQNGQLKKVISFDSSGYYVKEAYKKNGKQTIANGNGEFSYDDLVPNMLVEGEIKNGKQHGKWILHSTIYNRKTAIELFENGKFIEGESLAMNKIFNTTYRDYPATTVDMTIDLLDPGYYGKEECVRKIDRSGFMDHRKFNRGYYKSFNEYIYDKFDAPNIRMGYIIIGCVINEKGEVKDIDMYSTIKSEIVEKKLYDLFLNSDKWDPEIRNGRAIAVSELYIIQFLNGEYKILEETRRPIVNSN